jgi:hypothetical protein
MSQNRPAPDSRPLAIAIETPGGTIFREIRAASPLRDDLPQGTAAEVAAEEAAVVWGLPDFLFQAGRLRVGAGSRERGDRLVFAGERAAVLQVKSRVAFTGDESKERRWLEKHAAKALRQADGTIRRLRSDRVGIVSARGREVEVDGGGSDWISVVVLDHPSPPDDLAIPLSARNPSVVLTRRDWEFLFRQLKSTTAVLGYLDRVARKEHALGAEAQRYFNLALADAATPPGRLDERISANGIPHSGPLLPIEEAAGTDDFREHVLIRSILEDIARTTAPRIDELQRLITLSHLDQLTPNDRVMIGRYLIEGLGRFFISPPETTIWRVRRLVGTFAREHYSQLCFGTSSGSGEADRGMFGFWLQLRHHQLFHLLDRDPELVSVGVQLAPRPDGAREFDTTVVTVKGDLHLDRDTVAELEAVWPTDPA